MGIGILYLAGGVLLLWQGASLLVRNSARLAASYGIPKIIIGLTLVAFGTSTPELVVSLLSAVKGSADLSVGNVVGSNIVNTLGILGVAALFHAIPANRRILRTDAPVMLFFTVMAVCLGWDGLLRRWEGAALLLCFGGYMALLIRQGRSDENGQRARKPRRRDANGRWAGGFATRAFAWRDWPACTWAGRGPSAARCASATPWASPKPSSA